MPLCRKKTFIMQIRTYDNLTILYNVVKIKAQHKFCPYKCTLHFLKQSRQAGDYCSVNTGPSPRSLSDCHRTATVKMLQKNCVTPQGGRRDVGAMYRTRRRDRVLVWVEYTVLCHKAVVDFSSRKHFPYIL